jgi:mono/diheme cytochrome c family protein
MRTRLQNWTLLVSSAALLAFPSTSWAQLTTFDIGTRIGAESHVGNITGHAKDASLPYRRYCVGCHGPLGDGNGENAPYMQPPMYQQPRDFQLGIFKCRSTPTGTLPTDQDLFDAITRGFDRSNMPQWNTLSKQERADLVAWVKHFSPRWAERKTRNAHHHSTRAGSHRRAHQGGARCICPSAVLEVPRRAGHGQRSLRFDPSDDLGRPIAAFNFTDGTRPKCGDTDQDIYRIFMTGLDGTPMPSYADNIKPDEAWDLVFYLRTFMAQKSPKKRWRNNWP